MSDKIEEIRKRHSKRSEIDQSGCYRLDGFTYTGSLAQSQEDVDTLLAEDERHRAEIERLRADLATQQGCCDGAAAQDAHVRQERAEHKAEVEKLRADNERLRASLRECACTCSSIRECAAEWSKESYCQHLNARKALEGKP